MVEPGRYGEPGPRVRTSPFLFGLLATAGGLLAIVALFGIARVGTVLVMLVAATYFAIGLDRPVQLLVRRGLSRVAAVGIIAEVPSGALADSFGRRTALVVGALVEAVGIPGEHQHDVRAGDDVSQQPHERRQPPG